jgi:hypothetical protein
LKVTSLVEQLGNLRQPTWDTATGSASGAHHAAAPAELCPGSVTLRRPGEDIASLTADSDANRPTVPQNGSDGRIDWRGVQGLFQQYH